MNNKEYWSKRAIILEENLLHKGESYLEDLDNIYRKISLDIEKDLSLWYSRFAKNNSISITEAKKWLTTKELKELKWTIKEYIKYGQENSVNKKWMKQLENASVRYHISRLEAIKIQLQNHIEVLYDRQLDGVNKTMKDIYIEGYFNTVYEFQKNLGFGATLMAFSNDELEKILLKPWSIDGSNFSDRIWKSKISLVNILHQELASMIVKGEPPNKTIKLLSTKFHVSSKNAKRLVMTEAAYFASKSQEDCYNDSGVEEYEILSTLDNRTSEICQSLDGKVFLTKDYQLGVTAPPFHPNCRTTTVPYYEDDEVGTRSARSIDGKTYKVPSNMTYKDWTEKFVQHSK